MRHHSAFQTLEQSTTTAIALAEADANAETDANGVISDLESLHQAVLSRIRERHAALCDRADAWENYKLSLTKLLSWLDTAEKERNRLELRQIQEHGIHFCPYQTASMTFHAACILKELPNLDAVTRHVFETRP